MILFLASGLFAACNQQKEEKLREQNAIEKAKMEAPASPQYTKDMVENTKDPICNMRVAGGIADTAHYENKAYGFCSSECKAEFVANPTAYLDKMH